MADTSEAVATSVRESLTSLLVVFVVLRLTHVVDWSWWLVLAPLWVPAVLAPLLFVTMTLIADRKDHRG